MPSSPSHRHKRPCQPSITEFFSTTSSNQTTVQTSLPSASNLQTQWPAPRPLAPLPVHVQSSLMNVGMRIRKAVPEGYKTHDSDPAHKPFLSSKRSIGSPFSTHAARQRELVPYCAINNIGNLATKQRTSEACPRDEDLPDLLFPRDDDFDSPFSSQESRSSIANDFRFLGATAPATDVNLGRKRVWEDPEKEDQGADDLGFQPDNLSGQLLSSDPTTPLSALPMQLRPLAQPRSKKRTAAVMRQGPAGGMHAAAKSMGGSTLEDFEEADFFREENWLGEEMEFD